MGHGHSHAAISDSEPGAERMGPPGQRQRRELVRQRSARRRAGWLLSGILIPIGVAAVLLMVLLWPSGNAADISLSSPYAAAPGASIDTGKVQRTNQEDCPGSVPGSSDCLIAYSQPDAGGDQVPVLISPEVTKSPGVHQGDTIRYVNLSKLGPNPQGPAYIFMDFVRGAPMLLLALIYAVVVIAVARWRGFRALLGLVGAYLVLAFFILPGLVEGKPPLLLALVGSTVIMFGVLYFAHGISARTSTALIGTLFGLGMTAGIAAWATQATFLTGLADHNTYQLQSVAGSLSISGMIMCGLIISGLGVLNDVTITQSSAAWELYELAPQSSARSLFASAMRIGRDHIASTVYTIAFAYAGSALPVLIMVMLYRLPVFDALTSAELAEEIVRTLVGSVGLVLAIPVTTAVAVLVVKATGRGISSQPTVVVSSGTSVSAL